MRLPRRLVRILLASSRGALLVGLGASGVLAQDLPSGGSVVAGQAEIAGSATGLLVTQTSDRAIVDWAGFSIGAGREVAFDNGAGATLNRVTGTGQTRIDGLLSATGSVFLINEAGVVIGRDGVVDVGGSFVASTLPVGRADFMNGGDTVLAGASQAAVVNLGQVGALGGDVALVARNVVNRGSIAAPQGTAALVAGHEVLMRDAALADGRFVVRLGGEGTSVLNAGTIEAAEVELRANGGNVLALAGNTDGLIRATGVAQVGGRVFLTVPGGEVQVEAPVEARRTGGAGGAVVLNASEVTLGGRIDVSALRAGLPGGAITATGDTILLNAGARLTADGRTGGAIRIGGDFYGQGDIARAETVRVAAGAEISASGTRNAGSVVFWADGLMQFDGAIEATAGIGGRLGAVEVSGGELRYTGSADLRAADGRLGDLLLDPFNVTISTGASTGGFVAGANDTVINVGVLQTALQTANVTVSTGTAGAQAGIITVASDILWDGAGRLTLEAASSIVINAAIVAENGGLIINSGSSIFADDPGAEIDVAYFELEAGDWTQSGNDSLPDFEADDFRLTGGTFGRSLFATAFESGASGIIDIYGLQGAATLPMTNGYVLLNTIDASVTAGWNDGEGFVPIGTVADPFEGFIVGDGSAITDLVINRPTEIGVGLVGDALEAVFEEIHLVDADITGLTRVGGVVGDMVGGEFYLSWVTGDIRAEESAAGGLAGRLVDTYFQDNWTRASVIGSDAVGGLAGIYQLDGEPFFELIADSYAVGPVTATSGAAGGLIGQVDASASFALFEDSWASGAVTGTFAGGIIGRNTNGAGDALYFDTETTGTINAVGTGDTEFLDATGLTTAQAMDPASYPEFDFDFTWFSFGNLRPMLLSTQNFHIHVAEELQILAGFNSAAASQLRDIDLGPLIANPSNYWAETGWVPIGSDRAGFSTDYFGNGHVIRGLTINRPGESELGLFSVLLEGDLVSLWLDDVDITGDGRLGGLAGQMWSGFLADVRVDGTITGLEDPGAGDFVGGLIGRTETAVTLQRIRTDVAVTGADYVGGLIGLAQGVTAGDVMSLGAVTGNVRVGGLFGELDAESSAEIGYAAGDVTGVSQVGALVGVNDGDVASLVWDTGLAGVGAAFGVDTGTSLNVTGLTSAQLTDTTFFLTLATGLGWDTVETWAPGGGGLHRPELFRLFPISTAEMEDLVAVYAGLPPSGADPVLNGGPGSFIFGPCCQDELIVTDTDLTAGFLPGTSVGTYSYPVIEVDSALGQTYRVVPISGDYEIVPLNISLTGLVAQDKVYDTGSDAVVTGGLLSSIFGGDEVGFVLDANFLSTQVGTDIEISVSAVLTGAQSGNYTLDPIGSLFADITPRELSFSGIGVFDKVFDGSTAFSLFGTTLLGVLSEDDVDWTIVSGGFATANAGRDIPVNVLFGLIGAQSGNYTLVQPVGLTADITPFQLGVAPTGLFTRTYGDTDPEFTFEITGLSIGSSTLPLLTGSLGRVLGEDVGTYALTLGTLSAGGNYELTLESGSSLTITPRAITVRADTLSRIYGDADPELSFSIVDGSLVFDDTLFGLLVRDTGENVGIYGISQGSLSAGDNYDLTFQAGSLTITPRAITVRADTLSRIYGDEDPDLGYSIVDGSLVFDDTLSGLLVRAEGEDVGTYTISLGDLTAGSNYDLTFEAGSLTITPRSLTIAADDVSKLFGTRDPEFTFDLISGNFVFEDGFDGSLTRAPGEAPGTYAILIGSLTAGDNYEITFQPGELTIQPLPSSQVDTGTVEPVETIQQRAPLLSIRKDLPEILPEAAAGAAGAVIRATLQQTDVVVQELEDAAAYCAVIGQSEYVVDCLSERLEAIADTLPQEGDYAPAREAIRQAAERLSALVEANEAGDFPDNLATRSLRPDAPPVGRALRAVRTDSLDATLTEAIGIVAQTQTLLLRSVSAAEEASHYQRIATAVGSSTVLLRSV